MRSFAARRSLCLAPLARCLVMAIVAIVTILSSGCRRGRGLRPDDAGAWATGVAAKRVVSISANTTEALFAIGAGSLVVGRSRYCDFPPEALALPAVGGFVDPNLEAILALQPDLVVGARGPLGPGFVRNLDERGIATYFPETEHLEAIFEMLIGLGARTGHAVEAKQLVDRMRATRAAIEKGLSGAKRPRVLLLFAKQPISVAGKGGFPDEMLALAGAANVMTEGAAYPTVSLEKIIALDPDLVIDAEMGAGSTPLDSTWQTVRAVREGKVTRIADETLLRPGPRVMEGVARLARAVHPEVALSP